MWRRWQRRSGNANGSGDRYVPAAYPDGNTTAHSVCSPTPNNACLHELVVQHGVWVAAGGLQELVQALRRAEQTGPDKKLKT